MTRVMRVGKKFAKKIDILQDAYGKSLGKKIKVPELTDQMADSLEREGMFSFWHNDALKKRRRRKR